jgi:ankyrin repeat protein
MPSTNLYSLFSQRETGTLPPHVFKRKMCQSLLQQDFGVDVSNIVDKNLEHTLLWYQADYELFLARTEMSHDNDLIDLATALLDKKSPYLTGGRKGTELLQKMQKKLEDKLGVDDLNKRLGIRLQNADIKITETDDPGPRIFSEKKDREKSPLHLAAELGDYVAIKEILDTLSTEEARIAACLEKDTDGRTPLHLAAQSDSSDAVKEILAVFTTKQEKVNASKETDNNQNTAVHFVVQSKNPHNFDIIWAVFATNEVSDTEAEISSEQNDHDKYSHSSAEELDDDEITPLCSAIKNDHQKSPFSLQLELIDDVTIDDEMTPLHFAIWKGDLETFKKLWDALTETEKKSLTDKDEDYNPLFLAVMFKNYEIFEIIWDFFATADEKKLACKKTTEQLLTPLHLAAIAGDSKKIDTMLAIHTDIEKKEICPRENHQGQMVVLFAVLSNNPAVFEKIFSVFTTKAEKLKICQKEDNDGSTLLHFAARTGNPEIFKSILSVFETKADKIDACKKEDGNGLMSVDHVIQYADNPIDVLEIIAKLSPALIEEPMIRPTINTPIARAAKRGKAKTVEYLFKFLPVSFSLEDAEVLLKLSKDSEDIATQNVIANKMASMSEKKPICLDEKKDQQTPASLSEDSGNSTSQNVIAKQIASMSEKKHACLNENKDQQSPLHLSIWNGNLEAFKKLWATLTNAEKKSITEKKDPQGSNLLFLAAMCKNNEIFEMVWAVFVTVEEKKLACKKTTTEFLTLLHLAAVGGDAKTIECMLAIHTDAEKKEMCNKEDHQGHKPVQFAVVSNNPAAFEKIFSVFTTALEKWQICQKEDEDRCTLLHLAAVRGNSEIFTRILSVFVTEADKINACKKETGDGLTPVDLVIQNADNPLDVLKIIAKLSPALILEPMMRPIRNTPIANAAECGKAKTVEYLFKFLPESFSLENAEVLLTLSEHSGNFATQKVMIDKIISMLQNVSVDDRNEFLMQTRDRICTVCKHCGNAKGFDTVSARQHPTPAATM